MVIFKESQETLSQVLTKYLHWAEGLEEKIMGNRKVHGEHMLDIFIALQGAAKAIGREK